jgi:23S rRNA (pseudouridine1915-N3)-methyltransferase
MLRTIDVTRILKYDVSTVKNESTPRIALTNAKASPMKTVQILSVRKNTDAHIAALEADYLKRLKPFCGVELADIRATYADSAPVPRILAKETELFLKKIPARASVVALHETGKAYSSREFSEWFGRALGHSDGPLVFVIGSAYGLSEELLKSAREKISLSRMTFTHEFARLILLEQLYRATHIARGTDYHK